MAFWYAQHLIMLMLMLAACYGVLAACRPPLGLFLRQQRLVGMGHAPGYR